MLDLEMVVVIVKVKGSSLNQSNAAGSDRPAPTSSSAISSPPPPQELALFSRHGSGAQGLPQ
jgi:hypothetical protein